MITRAREQAAEFAAALEGYGARVVSCPTIEIVAPESYALLDDSIENLFGYDWIIFTSVNGVEHFLRRLEAAGKAVAFRISLSQLGRQHVGQLDLADLGLDLGVGHRRVDVMLEPVIGQQRDK